MRMKTSHDVTYHLGTFDMLGTEIQSLLTHGVQNSALNRLQTISDIGQRATGDHGERIIQIFLLRCLSQRNHNQRWILQIKK